MRKILFAACVLICFTLCGCSETEYEKSLFAMDTIMDLKIYAENDSALFAAEEEIKRIDALLDRGSENSEIYKINSEKTAAVSDETADLIRTAVDISEKTGGAFDITTAPVSDLWGFYGGSFRVPSDNELQNALAGIGYEKIQLDGNSVSVPENTSVDLGGIGKGYASDQTAAVLRNSGVKSAIVSLGGNVYALGKRPDGKDWKVGITDPADRSGIIGTVSVSDKSVVTSGGYQRYFERDGVAYHHIIDPKTGKSAQSGLSSVTVVSESGALADGLSTALFVMGLDEGIELWRESDSFDAVFVDNGGKIYITDGIRDAFKSERDYIVEQR